MTTLKFQQVRFCGQCKEPLPLKCSRCVRHPQRRPQVVELFDWPTILQTGPCGCLLIQCQAPGCTNKRWRFARLKSRTGKSVSKTFCCSPRCATAVANAVRSASSVQAECAYCGKPKQVQAAVYKLRRHIFCDASHHYMWVRKTAHDALEAAKAAIHGEEELAQLWCYRCRDIVLCRLKNERLRIYRCEKGHTLDVLSIEREHAKQTARMAVSA